MENQQLFDPELEQAVFGACFADPNSVKTIALCDDDFFINRNRWIFQAVKKCVDATGYADPILAKSEIDKAGHKSDVDLAYLLGIATNTAINSYKIADYVNVLQDLTVRRNAVSEAQKLVQAAYERENNINEVLGDASKRLTDITSIPSTTKHISYYISRHADLIDQRYNEPDKYKPIQTGMKDFDHATGGGLRRGEMMLLLGKPGLGKTIWAMQMGKQMGQHTPGVIFEMELPEQEAMDRVVSAKSKLSVSEKLELPEKMTADDWSVYHKTIEELSNPELKVYFDFGVDWNTATIKANLIRLQQEYKIEWFMLDYLKFLTDDYRGEEYARKAMIAGRLKKACKELDIAGVVIADMNKAGVKADVPDLSQIGGTSEIGFDVDKALFMTDHIPTDGEEQNDNLVTFIFDKSRRKINMRSFNMLKMQNYPAFGDVTR